MLSDRLEYEAIESEGREHEWIHGYPQIALVSMWIASCLSKAGRPAKYRRPIRAGIPPTHALSLVLGVGCASDSALHQDQGKQVVGYEARLVVAKHGLVSYQSYSVQSGSPVSAIEHQPPGTQDRRERDTWSIVIRWGCGFAVRPGVYSACFDAMSRSAG